MVLVVDTVVLVVVVCAVVVVVLVVSGLVGLTEAGLGLKSRSWSVSFRFLILSAAERM